MAISSNALFHFTGKRNNLIGILTDTFAPRFCLEDFTFLNTNNDLYCDEFAFPMVCFCDLPLSKIGGHIRFYGGYGIGMKKTWGIRKGITPVTYITQQSYLIKPMKTYIRKFMQGNYKTDFPAELIKYTKPVSGRIFRNGRYVKRTFYDEREWRYVPKLRDDRASILYKDDYLNPIELADVNSDMRWRDRLDFKAADIKYIIVKDEKEILPMAATVRTIRPALYDDNQINLLISRIITSKQIGSDF